MFVKGGLALTAACKCTVSLMMTTKVTSKKAQTLIDEYVRNWTAPDGGGLLKQGHIRAPFKKHFPNTAANDNAIIGTALLLFLAHYHGLLDKRLIELFLNAVRLREDPDYPGLYSRNPGMTMRHESWDNYAAISAGSALCKKWCKENEHSYLDHSKRIVERGVKYGYHFNNVDPGKYRLRSWKKGGDIAQYKINANYIPQYINLIWLWLHMIKSAFNKHRDRRGVFRLRTDTGILMWLKLRSFEFADFNKGWQWVTNITRTLTVFWDWRFNKKGGLHQFVKAYYGGRTPENPLVELSKGI